MTILAISFFFELFLAPIVIPMLRRLKFGQSIRAEGPKSHMKKAGTPTMGGVIFLISIIATTVIVGNLFDLIYNSFRCFAIGFYRFWSYWIIR